MEAKNEIPLMQLQTVVWWLNRHRTEKGSASISEEEWFKAFDNLEKTLNELDPEGIVELCYLWDEDDTHTPRKRHRN